MIKGAIPAMDVTFSFEKGKMLFSKLEAIQVRLFCFLGFFKRWFSVTLAKVESRYRV